MQQQSGPLFVLSTILTGLLSAAGFLYWVGMAEGESFEPRGRDSGERGGTRFFVSELAERHGLDSEQEGQLETFAWQERRHFSEMLRELRGATAKEEGLARVTEAWSRHYQWRDDELSRLFEPDLAQTLSQELLRGDEHSADRTPEEGQRDLPGRREGRSGRGGGRGAKFDGSRPER